MFLGRYEHSIDSKGRITIPARYRDQLEHGAYITHGFDQNLIVMPTAYFEQVYMSINKTSLTDPDARLVKRFVFSNADWVEADKAGRMLIPQFLREETGLDSNAIVVGTGDYFEIWTPESWEKQKEILSDIEANNQRFSALNITV